MQRFQKDSVVFVNDSYDIAEKCKVIDYMENESDVGKNYYKVHYVDKYGTFEVVEHRVFATKEDALKAYYRLSAKRVEQYKKEIKTLKDLLEFPLTHCLACGNEYTDYDAQRAYRIRVAELTGITL